jgi:molecular chaperone HtpG
LGDRVKDVKLSKRLQDSPSCIVADAGDPSLYMTNMMRAMGQTETPDTKPILEVNGNHNFVKSLLETTDEAKIADISEVLLGEALLVEGVKLKDSGIFVKSLNRLLQK